MRWFFVRQQKFYLYASAFIHGLTLSESQALVPATLALVFLVALGDRKLGREMLFAVSIVLWGILLMGDSLPHLGWYLGPALRGVLIIAGALTTLTWATLSFLTQRFFSEWKATSICAVLFLAGICFYFLLPVLSMTTPPVNWGYPRTVEGFFHVLSRGQFESIQPTSSFSHLAMQWNIFGKIADNEFGPIYLIAAAIPLFVLHRVSLLVRRCLLAWLTAWFLISLLMLVGLDVDSNNSEFVKPFHSRPISRKI